MLHITICRCEPKIPQIKVQKCIITCGIFYNVYIEIRNDYLLSRGDPLNGVVWSPINRKPEARQLVKRMLMTIQSIISWTIHIS